MFNVDIEIKGFSPEVALKIEQSSRRMFISRLENMQQNGDAWLTIQATLMLLNDCDMLAQLEIINAT